MSEGACFTWEQLTMFSVAGDIVAVSLFDGSEYEAKEPSELMKRLVPRASYAVMVGKHPQALTLTRLEPSQIPEGHEFCHYLIGGEVYAGTFVGTEAQDGEI